MRSSHQLYKLLEAVRQRLLAHQWWTSEAQLEAAALEAELYAYEEALLAGRPLPDLDAEEVRRDRR